VHTYLRETRIGVLELPYDFDTDHTRRVDECDLVQR
jgi:hypothetical protein